MKTAFTIIILAIVGFCAVASMATVLAQTVKTDPPDTLQLTVENEDLKKKIKDLEARLTKATEKERIEQQKQYILSVTASVKDVYADLCKQGGGKWHWVQGIVDGKAVTLVGCMAR